MKLTRSESIAEKRTSLKACRPIYSRFHFIIKGVGLEIDKSTPMGMDSNEGNGGVSPGRP